VGVPPYTALFHRAGGDLVFNGTFDNYRDLAADDLYVRAYLGSLKIAALATVLALLIGYPMAYAIALAPARARNLLLLLVILPFWTSLLVRVYAWMGMLRPGGVIQHGT